MPLSTAQVDEARVTSTSAFETELQREVEQVYRLFTVQDTFGSEGYMPILLGGIGSGQEWLTTRLMQAINEYGVRFIGKLYENSVKRKNTAVADAIAATAAKIGQALAKDAQGFGQERIEAVIKSNAAGFDGVPLFGDHTYEALLTDEGGDPIPGSVPTYSNSLAPESNPGAAWYLFNEYSFVEATRTGEDFAMQVNGGTSDSYLGFHEDAIAFGWRARKIYAPGFWANSVRSTYALTSENLRKAMDAQAKFKNDAGKRVGAKAKYLVVNRSNAAAAEKLIKAALIDGGNTNLDLGRLQLIVLDGLDD